MTLIDTLNAKLLIEIQCRVLIDVDIADVGAAS